MDFLGGIEGMNFKPISNYNNLIKESKAFEIEPSGSEFENILNQKTNAIDSSLQIEGGVQKSNIDGMFVQPMIQSASAGSETGNFLNDFSKSINNGLTSVNDKIEAANTAQETFAMGGDVSVHDVMISSEKALLSFQMATQLRNKLITAYNEINNIKV